MDGLIIGFDRALKVIAGVASASRATPAATASDTELTESERRHSAGLMRVNHVGEVCAQALYKAQGRFSQSSHTSTQFDNAAREEEDHLAWTAQRLQELNSHTSVLNPLWYAGAFAMGVVAARLGDARSLVIHPASTTHQQLSDAELQEAGVDAGMIRLSIGLETTEDLLWDLDQALQSTSP